MYIESCLFYDIYQGMASPFPKGEIHVPLLTIGMENRKGPEGSPLSLPVVHTPCKGQVNERGKLPHMNRNSHGTEYRNS